MKQELQDKIDNIMDWFEFDKVHKTMTALNWTWLYNDTPPTEQEIRAKARGHLKKICKAIESGTPVEKAGVDTGGFRVTAHEFDGEIDLTLEFIVERWTTG